MGQMLAARLPTVATLNGMPLPLVGRARVYACGITPYDVTHLGHAATFIWVDTLARVLHARGIPAAVYDLDAGPGARSQGGMLDIHAESGQVALRAAGVPRARIHFESFEF